MRLSKVLRYFLNLVRSAVSISSRIKCVLGVFLKEMDGRFGILRESSVRSIGCIAGRTNGVLDASHFPYVFFFRGDRANVLSAAAIRSTACMSRVNMA